MVAEKKENNLFLGKGLIEANAIISPEIYEHVALYTALYQTIFGSYVDYGFKDRAAVDVFINQKIHRFSIEPKTQLISFILEKNSKYFLNSLDKSIELSENYIPQGLDWFDFKIFVWYFSPRGGKIEVYDQSLQKLTEKENAESGGKP